MFNKILNKFKPNQLSLAMMNAAKRNSSNSNSFSGFSGQSGSTESGISPILSVLAIAIIFPVGAYAVWTIREMEMSNLVLLQLDSSSAAVRRMSINLLSLSGIAVFFVRALLPENRNTMLWRLKLWLLGWALFAFNLATLYQARFGIVLSAQQTMQQAANDQNLAANIARDDRNLRKAAAKADFDAADGLRANAAALRENARIKMEQKESSAATRLQREAATLDLKAAEITSRQSRIADSAPIAATTATTATPASVTEIESLGNKERMQMKSLAETVLISVLEVFGFQFLGFNIRNLVDARKINARKKLQGQMSDKQNDIPQSNANEQQTTPAISEMVAANDVKLTQIKLDPGVAYQFKFEAAESAQQGRQVQAETEGDDHGKTHAHSKSARLKDWIKDIRT